MSIHSDQFNDLDFDTRRILINIMNEDEIRFLEKEKDRIKKRYKEDLVVINNKIKFIEKEMRNSVKN